MSDLIMKERLSLIYKPTPPASEKLGWGINLYPSNNNNNNNTLFALPFYLLHCWLVCLNFESNMKRKYESIYGRKCLGPK